MPGAATPPVAAGTESVPGLVPPGEVLRREAKSEGESAVDSGL